MAGEDNSRTVAASLIAAVLERGAGLGGEPDQLPGLAGLDNPQDAAFARHLVYGVLRWKSPLEWLASQFMDRQLKRRDFDVQLFILIGLFELWKGEGAAHAAVNEAAESARIAGKPWAVGLVNAVLRRFQRERSDWLERLEQSPARFAHPEWLLDRIRESWPDDWQSILEANNCPGGLWLRVNRSRAEVVAIEEAMAGAGFETCRHPFAPDALKVTPAAAVERLPGFAEGLWSVQDPAAQLAIQWLDPQPGQHVLDACAAPGGKAFHVLEAVKDVRVLALDRSAARLERLVRDAARLGFDNNDRLRVATGDAAHPEEWWDGNPFERILLDAPCTATGVIRRHPEIKWLRTPAQADEAVRVQAQLLRRLWPLLKADGILVYATCSVLRDENSEQISRFVNDHPDAHPEAREVDYGRPAGPGRQILPGEADMDGFFYARIRKVA